jgi:hypothetical protein
MGVCLMGVCLINLYFIGAHASLIAEVDCGCNLTAEVDCPETTRGLATWTTVRAREISSQAHPHTLQLEDVKSIEQDGARPTVPTDLPLGHLPCVDQ